MKTAAALGFAAFLAFQAVVTAKEPPEYLASFDPAKGFKPAQDSLTQVFLQIAGSLEHYGSPEPYLRHMAKEHERIEGIYRRKNGHDPKSYRPAYMTDEYLNRLCANWNLLSPKLGLEPYAKDVGHMMRNAIKGTRGTGTIAIDILNQHQSQVFDFMAGKRNERTDFETLKTQLVARLEVGNRPSDDERNELARRDAVTFARGVYDATMKLFERLNQGLKPEDAERVTSALKSVITDIGRMAQSELEAGIAEWAVDDQKRTQDQTKEIITYTPELEKSLTPTERKVFAELLLKDRFTRSDFPALERFYSGPYDKLSERGKTEMSRRVHAGTR